MDIHPDEILFHKEWVTDLEELLESEGRQNLFQPSVAECRVVHEHMENKRWALAEESWQQVIENHNDINLVIIATGLRLYGMQGKVEHVERVWRLMQEHKIVPNDLMWIFRLVGHATDLRMNSASDILEEMKSKLDLSGPHFTHCFHLMMRGYVKAGKFMRALECFEMMKQVNQKATPLATAMAILSHTNVGTEVPELLKVFDNFKQQGQTSKQAYNVMIHHLGSNGLISKCIQYMEEMKASGLEPDETTYRGVILAAGKAASTFEMLKYFDEFKQKFPRQVIPGDFCNVIKFLGDHRQPARAEKVLKDMKDFGFRMKPFAYTAIIHVYTVAENWEKCEQLFEELCKYYKPSVFNYSAMVRVFLKSKQERKLRALIQHAIANHVTLGEIKAMLGPEFDNNPMLEPYQVPPHKKVNIGNPFANPKYRGFAPS